jgi:hypothetical protein
MEKRKIFILQIIIIVIFAFTALASATQEDLYQNVYEFQKGYRDGWNATAPEEYRY